MIRRDSPTRYDGSNDGTQTLISFILHGGIRPVIFKYNQNIPRHSTKPRNPRGFKKIAAQRVRIYIHNGAGLNRFIPGSLFEVPPDFIY